MILPIMETWKARTTTTLLLVISCTTAPLCEGCRTAAASRRHVEDFFSSYGFGVMHHEIIASGVLKEPSQREILLSDIIGYLDGRPGATLIVSSWFATNPPVRGRDFCASMASSYSGVPLHIFTYDSDEERDRKIGEFLTELSHQ